MIADYFFNFVNILFNVILGYLLIGVLVALVFSIRHRQGVYKDIRELKGFNFRFGIVIIWFILSTIWPLLLYHMILCTEEKGVEK
jgi:hypothetical protein